MLQDDWGEFISSVNTNGILTMAKRLGVPKKQEERDMVAAAQDGDGHAREQLIIRHSPFVVTVVKKHRFRGVECADLFSLGMIGMDTAITKFDLSRYRFRLISYGVWWARQEMLRAIQDRGSIVRIPAGKHSQMNKLRKIVKECRERGDGIDAEYLAKACKLSVASVNDLLPWVNDPCSFSMTVTGGGGDAGSHDEKTLIETWGYTPNDDVADESEYLHFFDIVRGTRFLTEKEKNVIIQRQLYGRTLDSVAEDYGVCRERIRQVEWYAMQKIKKVVERHDRVNGISRSERSSMLEMGVPQC